VVRCVWVRGARVTKYGAHKVVQGVVGELCAVLCVLCAVSCMLRAVYAPCSVMYVCLFCVLCAFFCAFVCVRLCSFVHLCVRLCSFVHLCVRLCSLLRLVHVYNYKDVCTDTRIYPRPRFASEYGYQSIPFSVRDVSDSSEGDWVWNSTLMEHRQHHAHGNEQI